MPFLAVQGIILVPLRRHKSAQVQMTCHLIMTTSDQSSSDRQTHYIGQYVLVTTSKTLILILDANFPFGFFGEPACCCGMNEKRLGGLSLTRLGQNRTTRQFLATVLRAPPEIAEDDTLLVLADLRQKILERGVQYMAVMILSERLTGRTTVFRDSDQKD